MKRLSGWQRLGVVVSVVWLVSSFVWVRWHRYQRDMDIAKEALGLCATSRPNDNWQENFNRCWEENTPLRKSPFYWPPILAFSLIPIPLFWLFGWAVLGTTRWVRAGFIGR